MGDFRWLLLAIGVLVLVVVFWVSRRESRGERIFPADLLHRQRLAPSLDPEQPAVDEAPAEKPPTPEIGRIITVRLMAHGHGGFPGEKLFLALRDSGLRHGRFGIFHFHENSDRNSEVFSVASLVEPGSFDLARIKDTFYPGVSLFMVLPSPGDVLAAFDQMLSTARDLAGKLDGDLLDEQGNSLSVQRERYLREEVIQSRHDAVPP